MDTLRNTNSNDGNGDRTMDLKVGNTVRYTGKTDDEIDWGYHQFDDPEQRLLLGNTYLVETIEIVSSYPRISLIGVGSFSYKFI